MIIRALLLLVCSGIFTFSFSQSKKSKKTSAKPIAIFSVNKKDVTAEEFIYLYKKNHQDVQLDYTTEKIEEYLTLYTNFKLKVEEARRRGMDTTEAFRKEFNQYKDELRKPYLPGNNLTDSLVKMTYERMKQEVRASHILVRVAPDAEPADTLQAYNRILELKSRVDKGEDFGKVALQFSEDESAKSNNGDLGYFTAMQMVYPFESAAFTTPIGSISKPVRTRFGYHILKVVDRRPAQGEVEVSHIMIRTGEDKSADQARNMIFDVFNELQAGGKWEELCRQYSEDPSSKENGGRMRPFGVGVMGNVPDFERVAFELTKPGQISDPVQTQFGWHIIRLERKIPLASFEEMAPNLKNRVIRDERSQVSKLALQTKLRKDLGFTEVEQQKKTVLALADTTLKTGKWNPPLYKSNNPLFRILEKNVGVNDFLRYARENQRPNSQEPKRYLEQLYNSFVDDEIMKIQEERIMQKHPEYKFLLNEYYEGILLFEIMEKEVWNKASEDSVGQYQYYQSNAAKYQGADRVKATFYTASTRDLIEKLQVLLTEGDSKKIQEFIAKNKIKSEGGYYLKDDKAVLKQIKWEKGMHTAENNGLYYLAWIKEVLPAGQMSFEEARPTLISDFQNHLEEIWVKELRKKFSVKVNESGKKYALEQLQKTKQS
jgi:peptidyl-prolyl cis-trans isomerase SurA